MIVALAVGGIEALGLVAGQLHLRGGFWFTVTSLNESFGEGAPAIVAFFVLRVAGFDRN